MSIFWFPEPDSAYNILVDLGYLINPGISTMGGGKEFIEVQVPRKRIEIEAWIILNDKYIKKPISVYAYTIQRGKEKQ